MIRKNRPRSSSLFLMELILAILFFSIAGAICVQLFIKAHLLSQDSLILTRAVEACTNLAEQFVAVPDTIQESPSYYDEDFFPCDKSSASYMLSMDTSKTASDITASIRVTALSGKTIYELETIRHIARRTGYEKQ